MSARNPSPRRPLASVVLLIGLLGLLSAGLGSLEVHFFADFNGLDEDDHLMAEVGTLKALAEPQVFVVEHLDPQEGVLQIAPNAGEDDARLLAHLEQPVEASVAHASFRITAIGAYSEMFVSLAEENDSGMIDISFTPDGRVRVGSQERPLPGGLGDEIDVQLELVDTLFGPSLFELTLHGPLGVTELSGQLAANDIDFDRIEILRPAGADAGSWELDDLLVTSMPPAGVFKLYAPFLDLSK